MSPKYTSLEDGQVIVTDEPRADLDALARWERDDSPATFEPQGIVPSSTEPVAGPVNKDSVTGGNPPLLSATAGVASPADVLSTEDAQRKAAEALGDGSNANGEPANGGGDGNEWTGDDGSTGGADEPVRPGLNGSTEEWLAYAKHPSIGVDVADDAGRDEIITAYIKKAAPGGNAKGDAWAAYASDHGVTVDEKDGRDKIRAAVIDAGWATA